MNEGMNKTLAGEWQQKKKGLEDKKKKKKKKFGKWGDGGGEAQEVDGLT